MSSRFITQTTAEKIPVCVLCPPGAFFDAFQLVLEAAGFKVVTKTQAGVEIYATVIVDLGTKPTFSDLELKELAHGGRMVGVSFDWPHLQTIKQIVPQLVELRYLGVVAPVAIPVSQMDQVLRGVTWDTAITPLGEECFPLWFEDVCQHVAHELILGKLNAGIYRGEKSIKFSQLIVDVRQRLKIGKGKRPKFFSLDWSNAKPIAGRGYQVVLGQIVEYLLQVNSPTKSATRSTKKVINPTKRRFQIGLVGLSCLLGVVLGASYAWYTFDLRSLAGTFKGLVYQANPSLNTQVQGRVAGELARVTFFSNVSDAIFTLVRQGKPGEVAQILPLVSTGIEGYGELGRAQDLLKSAYQETMQAKAGDSIALVKQADAHLDVAYKDFSLLQARLVQDDTVFPIELGGAPVQAQIVAQLPELRHSITTLRSLVGVLPNLIDGEKQHAFAFVLEDSSNLRGSGGTIESVAVLSFDKGKLLTSQVYSVSTLNQLLTGSVVAPDELKTFLHTSNWTLSDASWDVSYGKVAAQISWFLGKALLRSIDGVVVIPSNSLVGLLGKTGPIKLTTGETVNQDNYQSLLQTSINQQIKNPGALETFYTDIFTAVVNHLQQASNLETQSLLADLSNSFIDSDVFIGVGDKEAQQAFAALSWDGNPLTPACPTMFAAKTCRVSAAYEVENNIGQNNVGAYVKRAQVQTIRVGTDVLLQSRTITLTNTSSLLAWPLGSYQALIKLLIDNDAQVQGVSVDDQPLTPDKFSLLREGGKLVVRLAIAIPVSTSMRVRVVYTTPGVATSGSGLVFFEQKQAGTDEDPFTLIVTYPDSYTPKTVAPRANVGRSSLTFTSKHDTNHLFGVGF